MDGASNFPSELAYVRATTPPTSLQNWPCLAIATSNFPSELAANRPVVLQLPFRTGIWSLSDLQLPFRTGVFSRQQPPTSLQNWQLRSTATLQLPFRTGVTSCIFPPTSLQNWQYSASETLQLPFRTGRSLSNCIKIKGISALSTLSPDA